MAQSQVSDDGKYVRSRSALMWILVAFTVGALSSAFAVGIFRIGAYQFAIDAGPSAANGSASRLPVEASRRESPTLVWEGARVSVPDGSPLRGKLTVGAVGQREIQRKLILPAVVEADPARTVEVLTPATGRLTDLMAQLGERVVQGQELAVIHSGDFAQAYSDIEKARSVLTLTKKALDRQLGLEKAGGVAIKDREQAQSDYDQAVAELDRARSRLRAMGVPADQKEQSRLLTLKAPSPAV